MVKPSGMSKNFSRIAIEALGAISKTGGLQQTITNLENSDVIQDSFLKLELQLAADNWIWEKIEKRTSCAGFADLAGTLPFRGWFIFSGRGWRDQTRLQGIIRSDDVGTAFASACSNAILRRPFNTAELSTYTAAGDKSELKHELIMKIATSTESRIVNDYLLVVAAQR
jgi:hypothetical protein